MFKVIAIITIITAIAISMIGNSLKASGSEIINNHISAIEAVK